LAFLQIFGMECVAMILEKNLDNQVWYLATVHARDNQPTNQPTNDQRLHDTAYLNNRLFY